MGRIMVGTPDMVPVALRHCFRFGAGLVVPHPRVWAALERETKRGGSG